MVVAQYLPMASISFRSATRDCLADGVGVGVVTADQQICVEIPESAEVVVVHGW